MLYIPHHESIDSDEFYELSNSHLRLSPDELVLPPDGEIELKGIGLYTLYQKFTSQAQGIDQYTKAGFLLKDKKQSDGVLALTGTVKVKDGKTYAQKDLTTLVDLRGRCIKTPIGVFTLVDGFFMSDTSRTVSTVAEYLALDVIN